MEISKTGALNAFGTNTAVNKNTNNFTNDGFAQMIMAGKNNANKTNSTSKTDAVPNPFAPNLGQYVDTNNAFVKAIREINAANNNTTSAASQTASASPPLSSSSGKSTAKTPTGNFANDEFAKTIMAGKDNANKTNSSSETDAVPNPFAPNLGQYVDTNNAFVKAIRETNAANNNTAASQASSSGNSASTTSTSGTTSSLRNGNVTNGADAEKNIINRINNILSEANLKQMGELSSSTDSPVKLNGYYGLNSGMIFGNGDATYAPAASYQAISYIEVEKGEVLLSGSSSSGNDPTYLSFGGSNASALDSLVGVNGDFYARSYSNGLKTLAPVSS
ncbi:MAG: hypothetical protein IKH16_10125, partial [Selenomonadaceae bacterium]|nr:hypothetical protein [Selenomonadaceae bacterium]